MTTQMTGTTGANNTPREILAKCEELAREYFDGSGDAMAVAHSLRNVILARFEWVKKHGKDAGE